MAALWNRVGHYIFALWFLSFFFLLLFFPCLISAVARSHIGCLPYLCTWRGPSANLECRSEMCCTQHGGNAGPKKSPQNRHLGTIAQICRAISSQLRHVSTIGKKAAKQQYLLHMSSQYGELRPTSGWDLLACLGTPANFNGFRALAALLHGTLGVSQAAALNRGRHLYSAGRPSRWALAHISSL